ncbi:MULTISPECIES: cytochrome oxidase putative small subunit CydP [Mycetohabitans]|uniref:cytochrome oxidase putative small subunit CydP n=1 Tax=Mycetohabitans TaxID=2571159 RepID=UPI001F29FA22|nr:cytochrome oxidase putative small subunit CydP [Mycetohabitans sp. B3]MCF2134966.1 hypothetical protein [Mycetohabitans sp. B3]
MFSHDVRHSTDIDRADPAQRSGLLAAILHRPGLVRELTLVVMAKVAILLVFKYTLFSHPQAPHMELPPAQVAQALLSVPATHPPASGDHHDK